MAAAAGAPGQAPTGEGPPSSATPSAAAAATGREAYPSSAGAGGDAPQLRQQMPYVPHQQLAAQGISHAYPGMMEGGGPVDPTQAQIAAFANQAAMYGPYGSPYALNMPPPPTGGPYYPGLGAQLNFPTTESFSLPGPAYFDPYGMINPAACIAPVTPPENREVESAQHIRRKSSKKWFGCC